MTRSDRSDTPPNTEIPAAATSPQGTSTPVGDAPTHDDEVPTGSDTGMQDNAQQSNDVDMGYIGCLVPDENDYVSELLLTTLVSSGRSYARERRAACRRIVSEMYSPPRVTAEIKRAKHPHLVAGFAYDLTTVDPDDGMPWDFSIESKREKARRKCEEQRPYMLIGSPMCTAFCTWMALNEALRKDHAIVRAAREKAIEHINFIVSLYQMQADAGRYFLH